LLQDDDDDDSKHVFYFLVHLNHWKPKILKMVFLRIKFVPHKALP
jgi:hypothetical protein